MSKTEMHRGDEDKNAQLKREGARGLDSQPPLLCQPLFISFHQFSCRKSLRIVQLTAVCCRADLGRSR
jgi:hypothetical protein